MSFLSRLFGGGDKPQSGASASGAAPDPEALCEIGASHLREGRAVEAATVFQQATRAAEASLGPEHRMVAKTLSGVGLAYVHQGRFADAEAPWKRSLAIYTKVLGPDDDIVVQSAMNLVKLYVDLKRNKDALEVANSSSRLVRERIHAMNRQP